jgi:hypothetical protein
MNPVTLLRENINQMHSCMSSKIVDFNVDFLSLYRDLQVND